MNFQELQNNLSERGFYCYTPDDGGHYYFEIPNQGPGPNSTSFYFAEFTSKVQRIDIYPSYDDGFCHNVYYLGELKEKEFNFLSDYHLKSYKKFKEQNSLEQIKKDFE